MMKIIKTTILLLLLAFVPEVSDAQSKLKVNFGIKAGVQAVTYNSTKFGIDGYRFDNNNIQSDKIGYTINPFIRLTKGKFYLQTEAAFGVTKHHFEFYEEQLAARGTDNSLTPTTAEYNLTTYCVHVPLLFGYNFINYSNYGMSVFTGPRAKFILTSLCDQDFSNFAHDNLREELPTSIYYWEIGLGVRIYSVFFDFTYDWGIKRETTDILSNNIKGEYHSKRSDGILSVSVGFIL